MLRMTHSTDEGRSTLHLEGKLLAPWVGELEVLVNGAAGGLPQRIDLGGVTFVDPAGADLLRTLREAGVEITSCSAFVAELLESRGKNQGASKSA